MSAHGGSPQSAAPTMEQPAWQPEMANGEPYSRAVQQQPLPQNFGMIFFFDILNKQIKKKHSCFVLFCLSNVLFVWFMG